MHYVEKNSNKLLRLSDEETQVYHKDLKALLIAKGFPEEDTEIMAIKVHISIMDKIRSEFLNDQIKQFKEILKRPRKPVIYREFQLIIKTDEELKKMIERSERHIDYGASSDKYLVKELVDIGFSDQEIGDTLWLSIEGVNYFK